MKKEGPVACWPSGLITEETTMENYRQLIDPTTIGVVRSQLNSSASPIREVLFVAAAHLLPAVAAALDAESGLSSSHRLKQWRQWLQDGQVAQNRIAPGYGVDLEVLPAETPCRVIFLPPVYLVYVPGLDLRETILRAA